MTLKDIAKEAGVSISTVSRIINGNSSNAASKEMQDKIWSIARAGGYVPNTSAQALKQKNRENVPHHSIACVYARAQDAQNDAFFSTLTRSIEQEALKEGQKVKAKVLNTNDNKISLSMKALEEEMVDTEPAEDLEQYTSKESFGSSLGSLLAGIKLD